MKIKWTYAKNLNDMPKKSGRYLLMTEFGSFFIGIWEASNRKLYTQCIDSEYKWKNNKRGMPSQVRMTTGNINMAGWDWKTSGHVYWADIGELNFHKICELTRS